MNLLPKSKEEFSQKEYWDAFFKKRGNKSFEWYGEYPELSENLHKYIKRQDSILLTGCGNSTLGKDLYDIGYSVATNDHIGSVDTPLHFKVQQGIQIIKQYCFSNVTNIDISQVVIRQMLSQNEKQRENLKYIQMDALNMSFDNEQFNVVLDKGTLDALMPDDSAETLAKIKQYFDEMKRVLKIGGRYICISLLQEHILKYTLEYFPSNNFMFRIVRCFEAENKATENGESPVPVFIVICTKFKALPQKVLELNLGSLDKMERYNSEPELMSQVLSAQHVSFICSGLQKSSIADENEVVLDLFQQGSSNVRFTVYIVDIPPQVSHSQYAAFIVPEGREAEWLFSTSKGRKKLVEVTKYNRLAIITLHREQHYESFESIQTELTNVICNLAPAKLKNKKIPFLSLGSDVGHRMVKYKGCSELSGDFVIEDVITENHEKFRRLFYMNSQLVIQSEAKLRCIKSRKGSAKEVVDLIYLTCRHHVYMVLAAHVACRGSSKANVAVIGLGGGGLCSFLHKFLPKINILGVDIDKDMLKVAKEWFDFKEDDKMKAKIEDGIEWLKQTSDKGESLDALIFDVDSKDSSIGMSCPPKQFLEKIVLEKVVKIVGDTGLFILNVVLRDNLLRPSVLKSLKNHFQTILSYKLHEDLNEIFICTNRAFQLTNLKEACLELNLFFKKHNISENGVDVERFMKTLVTQSVFI